MKRTFDFSFSVKASLSNVAEFHRDTSALRRLTPPPVFVHIHSVEPLAEGSKANFTLWFGLLPVRWVAKHSDIDPLNGFTDTQISGPMKGWVHKHTFSEVSSSLTRITEHIEYEHHPGARGILSRLLFTQFGLYMTFCYRCFMTRRILERTREKVMRVGDIPE